MPPVETHEVHEKVRIDADKPYGCKDHATSDGYYAKDRIYRGNGTFYEVVTYIKHKMSADCRYDMSLADPRCTSCQHRGNGESYDAMVRSKGT